MDAKQFIAKIRPVLEHRLSGFDIRILNDRLPLAVEFLVTSDDFDQLSRGARIQFMADVVEEAFGLPLNFGPAGVALTPKEAQELRPWDDKDTDEWNDVGGHGEPAAMPAEHE